MRVDRRAGIHFAEAVAAGQAADRTPIRATRHPQLPEPSSGLLMSFSQIATREGKS